MKAIRLVLILSLLAFAAVASAQTTSPNANDVATGVAKDESSSWFAMSPFIQNPLAVIPQLLAQCPLYPQ